MSQRTKENGGFLKQGGILAAASIIVRFIGMLYRIPMANIIGEKGNGIYSVAFLIYDIVLIISSYSLPLALSKIISAQSVKRQYKSIGKTFRLSAVFALISGGLFCTVLFFGAEFIENTFFPTYIGVHIPLKVLAVTILIVAFLGVFRGFFQGKRTMMPTAVSQIIEQVINAVVSVLCAYLFIKSNTDSPYRDAYGAAGGTMGTCLGALAALLFLGFLYYLYQPVKRKQERRDRNEKELSAKTIYLTLFMTIIPIILSQTVYQSSGLIDTYLFGGIMPLKGTSNSVIQELTGVYSSKYQLLCSVPIAISTAVASSMIPSMVSSYVNQDTYEVKKKISLSIKFNMMIAFPCAAGLMVFGNPIIRILFPGADAVLGGRLMLAGSISIVFFALSNVTGGALQSIDKMRLPVIHSAISLILHIAIVLGLLKFTDLGIYSLVIGNVTFPIMVFILNFMSLKQYIGYKQEIMKTFFVPISASLWMAVISGGVYLAFGMLFSQVHVQTIIAVVVAIILYFIVYLRLRGVKRSELLEFPMGGRLYRLAVKMHLMK